MLIDPPAEGEPVEVHERQVLSRTARRATIGVMS
jgi:hypothetical protein